MREWLKNIWNGHSGAVVGAAFGLLAAVLMLTINFWRTLLLLLLIGGGALLGVSIQRMGLSGLWRKVSALFSGRRK